MRTTRSLSIHAGYRCRSAGACCTANWPIPVEADRLARLQAALAQGRLRPAVEPPGGPFVPLTGGPAETPAVLAVADHACVFFDAADDRLCRVQRALGHDALPLACRQFPRVVVEDPRGVSITLSHFCPTAAGLLESAVPVAIVESPTAFPAGGEYEGLDARRSLPPMLRPDMLMDWDSWWEWERLSVDLVAESSGPPAGWLARLQLAVEHARSWTPRDGPLLPRVRAAFERARTVTPREESTPHERAQRVAEVIDAIPVDLQPRTPARTPRATPPEVVRRYLAAHVFANWTAHLGRGMRAWLRSIDAAYALLESGLDVREADLQLRHLADPNVLAETWSRAE